MNKQKTINMLPIIQTFIEEGCSQRFVIDILRAMAQEMENDMCNGTEEW